MTNEEFIKNISFEGEEWKDIKDFEGLYMISSYGRIISCSKRLKNGNGSRVTKPKLSIPGKCRGYYQARLSKEDKQYCPYIHRLIAEYFIPNPSNYKYVDHIDGNRTNNDIKNLRWCTASMNRLNPITHDKHRKSMSSSKRMEISRIKPIVRVNTNNPSDVEAYLSPKEAEKDGFNRSGISECCNKKNATIIKGINGISLMNTKNLSKNSTCLAQPKEGFKLLHYCCNNHCCNNYYYNSNY